MYIFIATAALITTSAHIDDQAPQQDDIMEELLPEQHDTDKDEQNDEDEQMDEDVQTDEGEENDENIEGKDTTVLSQPGRLKQKRKGRKTSWIHHFFTTKTKVSKSNNSSSATVLYCCQFPASLNNTASIPHPHEVFGPVGNIHIHLKTWHPDAYHIAMAAVADGKFTSTIASKLLSDNQKHATSTGIQ